MLNCQYLCWLVFFPSYFQRIPIITKMGFTHWVIAKGPPPSPLRPGHLLKYQIQDRDFICHKSEEWHVKDWWGLCFPPCHLRAHGSMAERVADVAEPEQKRFPTRQNFLQGHFGHFENLALKWKQITTVSFYWLLPKAHGTKYSSTQVQGVF